MRPGILFLEAGLLIIFSCVNIAMIDFFVNYVVSAIPEDMAGESAGDQVLAAVKVFLKINFSYSGLMCQTDETKKFIIKCI